MTPTLPAPRPGWLGLWDRLVGPGMPRSETTLVLASASVFAAVATLWLAQHGASPLALAVAAVLAFDVAGGAVCNATDTTKRWYHRPGLGPAQHLGFALPHLVHVAAVAWLLRPGPFDIAYLGVVGGALVLSAALIVVTRPALKRPVAAALTVAAIGVTLAAVGPTPGLEWFAPALFLKLLAGHLVPEAPSTGGERALTGDRR